jgi:hypothetical protein
MNVFSTDIWVDSRRGGPWLTELHNIASSTDCKLICDQMHHWRESVYVSDYKKKGPTILAGGAANDLECSTAILHELGHHILCQQNRHPHALIDGEKAAWNIAQDIARQNRLPFDPRTKRTALYSYRYRQLSEFTAGSKRKNKIRPAPKSWLLEGSRRSSVASAGCGVYSLGKRGKRHAKREIKKATARAERRIPATDE